MDKQYTIEEVEAMIEEPPCSNCKGSGRRKHCRVCGGTGREDHLYGEERIIIRQLLARVKELEAVEEMLKGCSIVRKLDAIASIAGYKLHADQVHFDSKQMGVGSEKWEAISFNNGNWKSDVKTDSLYDALQSLIQE